MGKTNLDETYVFEISIKIQFFWCNYWYQNLYYNIHDKFIMKINIFNIYFINKFYLNIDSFIIKNLLLLFRPFGFHAEEKEMIKILFFYYQDEIWRCFSKFCNISSSNWRRFLRSDNDLPNWFQKKQRVFYL